MDYKKALETVTQGLSLANKRGAFEMNESAALFAALTVLNEDRENSEDISKPTQAKGVKKA